MTTTAKGRAYSTKFEDHERLIRSLARKGFGRMMAARVTIDFDDVYQEMCLYYVKAADKYDAEKGVSFTAYLGQTIWNEFNKFAERQIAYKVNLKLSSLEAVGVKQNFSIDDEDQLDLLETIDSEDLTPEEIVETKQTIRTNNRLLGPVSSFIVKQLMEPSDKLLLHIAERRGDFPNSNNPDCNALARAGNEVTVRGIISFYNIPAERANNAKRQLRSLYGVNI